jgi:poly(A) polymerase Pap1
MKKMENELLTVNLANGIIKKSRKQGKDIDELIKSALSQPSIKEVLDENDQNLKRSIKKKTIFYNGVPI